MMDDTHEVMITESDDEAAYYAARKIPYIVWLNESCLLYTSDAADE